MLARALAVALAVAWNVGFCIKNGCRERLRLTMEPTGTSIHAIMPYLVHGIGYAPTNSAAEIHGRHQVA